MFFNRLGEIRDRSVEQQRYRASGLNLLTAAIVLWNTVYLDRTIATPNSDGGTTAPDILRFLSPPDGTHQPHLRLHLATLEAHQTRKIQAHYAARQNLSVQYFTNPQATPTRPSGAPGSWSSARSQTGSGANR